MHEKIATIIAITGGSGSGKTSLIAALRQEFETSELCVISQDDYYKPRSLQTQDPDGYLNFDLPSALDLEDFERDLCLIASGKDVERPVYSFNNEMSDLPPIRFRAAPVIIIEGLFLFAKPSLVELIDYSIYVHAKEDLKLIRRIKRDQSVRNYSLDEILHRYQNHVMPAYATYIRHIREYADLVVNNNESFQKGLDIISAFIRSRQNSRPTPI